MKNEMKKETEIIELGTHNFYFRIFLQNHITSDKYLKKGRNLQRFYAIFNEQMFDKKYESTLFSLELQTFVINLLKISCKATRFLSLDHSTDIVGEPMTQ